ncbi:MAG: cytotoxic translational repressor of toxin-antitoxin stability system [Oligoflexia bacterium]|nr:cytotoxic translational repressor of toxin-antitoxin stability system [Oligoflexia bacterium]
MLVWSVNISKKTEKNITNLPEIIQSLAFVFIRKIEMFGPYLERWDEAERLKYKNYGKLKGSDSKYHCHLKKGKPTYVVCWEINKSEITVEVYYVGTHEKAPY